MPGQVCAIVGIGPNIGLAVARRFAREGFKIALVARNRASLESYAQTISDDGGEAYPFPADGADAPSLRAAFSAIEAQLGAPQVLVYNACTVRIGPADTLSADDLIASFKLDVAGALVASQAVLPAMRKAGKGTILFTGGGSALEPELELISIGIGKAGLRNLCFSLAKTYEPDGIHVATVTVCGWVQPGTKCDPGLIAERYWELHGQPKGGFQREIMFD